MSKIDLRDTTFAIPTRIDHENRQENLEITYDFLNSIFDTTILVGESGPESVIKNVPVSLFTKTDDWFIHKTKMLNDLYKMASTPIVCMWDTDLQTPPHQIVQAVERIRAGADAVYPYNSSFYDFNREEFIQYFREKRVIELPLGNRLSVVEPGKGTLLSTVSFGGCCFHDFQSFKNCGLENELFKSVGPEDSEKYYRLRGLGKRIERVEGVAYHLGHYRGKNQWQGNEFGGINERMCNEMANMGKHQIEQMIATWEWAK